MDEVTIYFNPSCSKCRGSLELLREQGAEPRVVEYLETPPTTDELRELLTMMRLSVRDIVRTSEPEYARLGLEDATDDELLEAMVEHPILIQRPIVVANGRAVIGRPPERVIDLFDGR